MATRYRFGDSEIAHFITFAVVNWIDALSRPLYKDIIVESLGYCLKGKRFTIIWLGYYEQSCTPIVSAGRGILLADIIRDLKKYTSKQMNKQFGKILLKAEKSGWCGCLKEPEKEIVTIRTSSFGNKIIIHLSYMDMKCYNKSCCICMKTGKSRVGL